MSGADSEQDFATMKKLLTSWHVEIVYDLFKEEEIGMPELIMMQTTHINCLLKNYKMGVKIRFEHHFNNWRNKIGIPLKTEVSNREFVSCCCSHNKADDETKCSGKNVTTAVNRKRDGQNFTLSPSDLGEVQPLSPQSVHSENSLLKALNVSDMINFAAMPVLGSPTQATHNTDDEQETDELIFNPLSDLLSSSELADKPKFPSKPTPDKCPVNLAEILRMTGQRGMAIMKFYKEKKRLTNIHRAQLIQTIVEFFAENDYHLSLNASHNLEWEILKMFPTEKLEYYRTEKRGKIYVKFSNMKRYKRERNNKLKHEMETLSLNLRSRRSEAKKSQIQNDGLLAENVENISNDQWTMYAEPEIEVKEENIDEIDMNEDGQNSYI